MKGALITTDMCSRGLDIKGINWVINFDCPDGVKSYIHRVGRTARYKSDGFALLFLLPPEIKMVSIIKEAKIPIVKVKTKFASEQILEKRFASFLAEDEALKYLAQKAVVCYIRSLTKTKNGRQILDKIDFEKMCKSMGLPNAPSVSFKRKKVFSNEMESSLKRLLEDNNSNAELNLDDDTKQNVGRSKIERLLKRENKTVYSKEKNDLRKDSEDDSDFFSASAE
ncbi:ATP-dependent RNA helicase dbp4 [Bonamia ostreae]|uniref:ATP-dependent RNA helicase n=1 Tax=Bonamia ostreae TaxID=126728 RepID=A0ABV2AHT6_9EUKA